MDINSDDATSPRRDKASQLKLQATGFVDILESLAPDTKAELIATLALDGFMTRSHTDSPSDLATLVLDGLVARISEQ